jgi:hypothetical protein
VCTSNPFYVLSAVLFLYGLRESFADPTRDLDSWALTAGLTVYTLLLAAAALFLVRLAGVWNDVRTVLLLVVLMFLATSVTFDELLALDPARGTWFYLGGFALAVGVSESLLHGLRLQLPVRFRLPYYLILGLFFGYPVALTPLLGNPHGEPLLWALWGFAPVAGLAFLTLLPAARRGAVSPGGPWPWPYYPWAVFVFLAVAVVGRAFLLCWSFHLFDASGEQIIFGPYFLVPFGFALAVLVLELGLTAFHRPTLWAAVAAPAGLIGLAAVGHREDPVYAEFLGHFQNRLWGTPLFVSLLVAAGYYGYAWFRRVPYSAEGLTAVLAALSVIGSESMTFDDLTTPEPLPLVAAGLLQFLLGLTRGSVIQCLIGTVGLACATTSILPGGATVTVRATGAGHVAVLGLLLTGGVVRTPAGWWCRLSGVCLATFTLLAAVFARSDFPPWIPGWVPTAYPAMVAVVLILYGLAVPYRFALVAAGIGVGGWLGVAFVRGYRVLREDVTGLDYLATGMVLLPFAVVVSLGKGGAIDRWFAARRRTSGQAVP